MDIDYDILLAAVKINLGSGYKITMVAGWTFRDVGMEPIRVLVYDADTEDTHDRRVAVVQGLQRAVDIIIDHMEGW